jgi:hypothetical protein
MSTIIRVIIMFSESGYLEAKKMIISLENEYAMKAMKAGSEHDKRKFWGYSDGMKECLKILTTYVEKNPDVQSGS